MVKTIKIAGMDAYIKKFKPDNSNVANSNAATNNDGKSVKTTKKSTAKK